MIRDISNPAFEGAGTIRALMVGGPHDGEEFRGPLYIGYNFTRFDKHYQAFRDEYQLRGPVVNDRAIYDFQRSTALSSEYEV